MEQTKPSVGVWNRVATRTRSLFQEGLRALGSPLAPEFYESLEELLIAGDVGPALAARLSSAVRARKPRSLEEAQAALEAEVVAVLSHDPRALNLASNPSVILVYGIHLDESGRSSLVSVNLQDVHPQASRSA